MLNASAQMLNQRASSVDHVVAAWPTGRPLVMLHSAARHDHWGRWSVLSSPERYETSAGDDRDPLAWLEQVRGRTKSSESEISNLKFPARAPFSGGLLGYFSYELGRLIEPAAQYRAHPRVGCAWPLIELAYCPAALVHDNVLDVWHAVGDADAAHELIEQLDFSQSDGDGTWQSGDLASEVSADSHLAAVARTLEYIGAGDIFQANITQQFRTTFTGCTRSLARHALRLSGARYGAYLELPDGRCIVSMSPELFLQVDAATRRVTTRPIKGTRPQHRDPYELANSAKDAAELHMITDLMRNDLGRVCEFGSIHVAAARMIETHPTVHHGVSTIIGTLRRDVQVPQLLAATFPAGSVTGAPKIRAMQIIDELEEHARGPYCGAIGMISNCGNINFNVAIRTMLLQGLRDPAQMNRLDGTLTYGAGGGIVADSDPLGEYRESMDKAAVLRLALMRAVGTSLHADLRV